MNIKQAELPTKLEYDYSLIIWTDDEYSRIITKPIAGYWYIMLYGYEEYSEVSFVATYSSDIVPPTVTVIEDTATDTIPEFNISIIFSEKVTSVNLNSITVAGTDATINLRELVPGLVYEATLSGAEQSTITLMFSDAITDLADNKLDSVSFTYTIGDFTAPTSTVSPQTMTDGPNSWDVTIVFDEDVTGIANALNVTGGSMSTPVVTSNSATVTLSGADMATVTLNIANTITDFAGNHYAGGTFTYTVGDNTDPMLDSLNPTGYMNNNTTFYLLAKFNENIQKGAGKMTIYKKNNPFLIIDAIDITINGKSFNTFVSVDKYSSYWVSIDNGFVKDASGNPFTGISDSDIWTFSTGDFAVGIDLAEETHLMAYPNPFNEFIYLKSNNPIEYISISNITGQTIFEDNNPTEIISTKNFKTGVYFLFIHLNNGSIICNKMIKNKRL